jgi:hypothetical protein
MSEIHNIYFMRKDGWTQQTSEQWLKSHGYKVKKKDPHILGDEIRYNQMPKQKFKSFFTKVLPNGVHMIFGVRKQAGSGQEKTVEKIYNRILHEIVEPAIGNKITYTDELNKAGRKLLGHTFTGAFPRDELDTSKNHYCVLNVDKSSEPGSHWLGCVVRDGKTYVYDSFGRTSRALVPNLLKGGKKVVDADYDAEQMPKEDNCGARALAWLVCVEHLGLDSALLI